MESMRVNDRIAVALCLGLTLAAGCASADPAASLRHCRAVADPTARLACYDRAADEFAAPATVQSGSTETPRTQIPVPAPESTHARLDPHKTFGLPEAVIAQREVAAGVRSKDVREIRARLVGITLLSDGRVVFQLDNGQRWRELLAEGDLLAKVGDPVVVSRGWFGSFMLKVPSGRDTKVDRIR
ncbi:MAG: hypothetical protein KGL34_06230 [Gammaproteobacteria bacterium]|nr:hypothetical protein [Gammaproteobacteria bacterium]